MGIVGVALAVVAVAGWVLLFVLVEQFDGGQAGIDLAGPRVALETGLAAPR